MNGLRFSQDSVIGKLSHEDLEFYDQDRNLLIYKRGTETIEVPDLPVELDEVSPLEILLWKKSNLEN